MHLFAFFVFTVTNAYDYYMLKTSHTHTGSYILVDMPINFINVIIIFLSVKLLMKSKL